MSWNHRVVFDPVSKYFGIREVYYDHLGAITSGTHNDVTPTAETVGGLIHDLSRFIGAASKPILMEDSSGSQVKLREMSRAEIEAIDIRYNEGE